MSAPGSSVPALQKDDLLGRRIEEAGLNNMHTRRQLVYDGWLLFLSPGRAKRARSVNAYFGSTLALDEKIVHCERVYAKRGLPLLFRITPFVQPASLDDALARRGYVAFDETLVKLCTLEQAPLRNQRSDVLIERVELPPFVEAIGECRGSDITQCAAHLERLANSPLDVRPVVARGDRAVLGGGIVSIFDDIAGVFDVFTVPSMQRRGVATVVVSHLLVDAWQRGARHFYLQVSADNAAAIGVYRKFGFATCYRYHYRAREGDVE